MRPGELHATEAVRIPRSDVPAPMPPEAGTLSPAAWLDALLESEHLFVAFQPIVDLRTAEVVGREVLGRIAPGTEGASVHGITGPAALLELAHAHGRLVAVDRRFREIGIETLARVPCQKGMFFLNVDPRVIEDPAFSAGFTRRLLDEHGVPPTRIVLELTESGAELESDRLERIVRHYESQGFRIALDDVGAGYASLTALIRVRPHFLKLDKALVRSLADDPLRAHLVRALADFGRSAGIQVIAEGIEDERDLFALLGCGVELGQGYLLARPAPHVGPLPEPVQDLVRQASIRAPESRPARPEPSGVGALLRVEPTISPRAAVADVEGLLRRGPTHAAYAVADDEGRVVGLLARDRLLAQTSVLMRAGRPVTEVMDPYPLRVDENASVELVAKLCASRDEGRMYDPVIVERGGRYAGLVTVHALLAARVDAARY
jgi:EAL domain-containing protein (putative c-di-GMP-specific phosphodiesterase class I)/CBS domain-containing protein